ncbi:GNAT family N-acetyltransferase [Crocosphaera sp. UHCC 0190]|uniref:GNAT family N-acetyltransferase n=1 Tax=Crocosphaera sp. UHCC 0190 TaxID=3110246 RepID=UPI002B1FBC2B|nr:GNAT family N-acetyltransferase [Crocosphaera sp. UHCC 0190]MEA5509045.1 GNAT family N-acetyltransferase [Crocosphaera sp. UHCC 0190]
METKQGTDLPSPYQLQRGSTLDHAKLLKFMQLTYQELFPEQSDFSHLKKTVSQYFSAKTPLWWIILEEDKLPSVSPVACLWMGTGIDQVTGDRYGHIFLIYVMPQHRRRGLATQLINQAKTWVISQGNHQLGLQVFDINQPALNLYDNLGFKTQSRFMFKSVQ